tara:strand:- start:978 stop:1472 length:495 start_codon:yes stop_codon:yes gene_type:complete
MRKLILFFMFILLSSFVCAEQVYIFNFNYDNGVITLKDQIIKDGYYPDRLVSVDEGYNCKLVGLNGKTDYSFDFELPNKVFVDSIGVGGVVVLDETDFSFIAPYLSSANEIVCSNVGGYEILKEDLVKVSLSPDSSKSFIWVYFVLGFIGLLVLLYTNKKRFNR